MFSSRRFAVLRFTPRPVLYFELVFWVRRRLRVHVRAFACERPVAPAPFVMKTALSLLDGLRTSVPNQLSVCVRVHFWTLLHSIGLLVCIYISTMLFLSRLHNPYNWVESTLQLCPSELFYSGFSAFPYGF